MCTGGRALRPPVVSSFRKPRAIIPKKRRSAGGAAKAGPSLEGGALRPAAPQARPGRPALRRRRPDTRVQTAGRALQNDRARARRGPTRSTAPTSTLPPPTRASLGHVAVAHDERLAVVDAGGVLPRFPPLGALVALVGEDGQVRELVAVGSVFPRPRLRHGDAALVVGEAVLHAAGHLARMAPGAVVVVDQHAFAAHGYLSPSDTLRMRQTSDLQFAPKPVDPNSGGTSWFAFDAKVS